MEIKRWKGLRNTTSPERFGGQGYLSAAQNVEIDDTGRLLTRLGTSLASAGSYHSLWADGDMGLVVNASTNDLCRVNADYSLTVLTRLSASRRLSYSRQLNTVYASNGVDRLRIREGRVGEWGIRPPVGQPVAAATGGQLRPGRYQYALTYRRADQSESGTGVAGMIVLDSVGGIAFSSIGTSSDPEVVDKCLYLSGPDGEELFRLAVISNSTSIFNYYGSGSELSVRLETMFDNPPPAGDIVESHNGVMYVVAGDVAWHSRPYQFERFCYRDQWLRFPGQVTMFAAVNDGLYVSTPDVTWFLSGASPQEFKSRVIFDYGAIPGTVAKTSMGALRAEEEAPEGAPSGDALVWSTPRGICFGTDGGNAINMSEREYSLPGAPRGAGIVRQARGMTQYLVALEGLEQAASDAFQIE